MKHLLRVYRALFVADLQMAAQYRLQFVLYLLFAVVRPVVFLAAWSAAASAQGGAIGDFTTGDFAAYYVCLTLVMHLSTAWNSYEFELEVRQGKLSPKLLRPLHALHYAAVTNVVFKVTTLPALVPALLLIAWTFHARFETQPWHVALFVPSVVLGAAMRFVSDWVLAALAFWMTRIQAVTQLFDRLSFVFAGQIAPLSLLPGALGAIGYALPFAYMLWVPTEILRGGLSLEQALILIGAQVAWLVVFWVTFAVVWSMGLRQYSAVGA